MEVINKEKYNVPVFSWCPEIEENAMKQVETVVTLPFLHKRICVMPDCHMGYGMPIGGVVALKNVISPNMVGVDIGCFTEDTKVKLADNRELSFKELIEEDKTGKTNYCYSLDENNNVIIEKIIAPRLTRKVNELIEITLDNNKKIKCTLDHKFYLRNGKEIQAKELTVDESLMPLYINKAKEVDFEKLSCKDKQNKLSEYHVVYNPNSLKYDFCHRLADEYNHKYNVYSSKGIRHHIDFNKYNNSPENIQICKWKEHWKIHYLHAAKLNKLGIIGWKKAWEKNYDKFKKLSSTKMTKLHSDPEFAKRRDTRASKQFKKYNQSEEFYIMTRNAGKRGKKHLVNYNKSEKGCAKSKEIANRIYICKECGEHVKSPIGLYMHMQQKHPVQTICKQCNRIFKNKIALSVHLRYCKNHKITKIKKIQFKNSINVYCLTVNKYHNFALASGVFVHNCGMCAVKTSLTEIDIETLKKIMGEIRKVIPVGFNKHQKKQDKKLMPFIDAPSNYHHRDAIYFGNNKLHIDDMPLSEIFYPILTKEYDNALKSLGSLGSGNHFIEIQKGSDGHIWIMIHSGSRNLGKQVCDHYKKLAYDLNHKWHSKIPEDNLNDYLGFLPVNSEEGQAYIKEMKYCVDFALANRKLMMDRIIEIFSKHTKVKYKEHWMGEEGIMNVQYAYKEVKFDPIINIAHNYASQENHFGKNVWIHRKGATQAKLGQIGIIPGSQGSTSYIVEGLGNPESFESCSHGAGRKLGRGQARRELNLEEEIKKLDDQNIIHGIRHQQDLDEAASCYKDIDNVILQQVDLIKPIVKLTPLGVIKG